MEETVKMGLGPKIAILARRKGYTQERLANEAGISRISVNRFFREHTNIRSDDLKKILKILGIDLEVVVEAAASGSIYQGTVVTKTTMGPVQPQQLPREDLQRLVEGSFTK